MCFSPVPYFGFAILILLLIIVYIVNFTFLSAILLVISAEINSSVSVDWDHAKGQPKNKRFVYVYMLCSESLNSVFSVECFQLSTQLQQS